MPPFVVIALDRLRAQRYECNDMRSAIATAARLIGERYHSVEVIGPDGIIHQPFGLHLSAEAPSDREPPRLAKDEADFITALNGEESHQ